MNRKPKLLFAIKSLNVEGGGAERVLVDVANGLLERDYEVQVLTFDSPGISFYPLHSSIKRIDLGIGLPGRPTPRLGFISAIPRIRYLVRSSGADLVIPFMHSTYVPLAIALIGTGILLIVSEHTDAAHYHGRPLQRYLRSIIDGLAAAKTVPASSVLEVHSTLRSDRILVLHNPVHVPESAKTSLTASDSSTVLCVGGFRAEKNHLELIAAFSRVAADFPAWNLRIVGDGVLRAELEAEISSLGMSRRIILPGMIRDVASEYTKASFVVLPSLYEAFPMVATEALASERPVLAFDHYPGIVEMVRSGQNGLLVTGSNDSETRVRNLAAGLARLMSDADLRQRLGAAGPESVRKYSLESVLDAWENLINKVWPVQGR